MLESDSRSNRATSGAESAHGERSRAPCRSLGVPSTRPHACWRRVRRVRYVSVAGGGARAQDGGNRKESGHADVHRPRKLHRTGDPQRPGLAQAGGRVPQAMREGQRARQGRLSHDGPLRLGGVCRRSRRRHDELQRSCDNPFGTPNAVCESRKTSADFIQANREYYQQVSANPQSSPTSPFNGSSGTGYGTLANRPLTCTAGTAYLATDQGSWNTTTRKRGALIGTVPDDGLQTQGVLYICTATDTWTTSVPLTFPHPIVSGT